MKKIKTVKQPKYETEEQKEIKKFILVLVGLIVIIVGVYFFTRAFVTKDLFTEEESDLTYSSGSVSDTAMIVGNMLNRPYTEYYVIAYDSESTKVNYYNALISLYVSKEDYTKIYYIDLNNVLNEKYVATDSDIPTTKFTTLDELKLGEITLLKIKNKKVTKIITTVEEIKTELSL